MKWKNKKRSISTPAKHMATKLGSMMTKAKGNHPMKSNDNVIM